MRRVINVLALLVLSLDATAATISVGNSGLDELINNGACSLREAVINANTDSNAEYNDCAAGSGADVIELAEDETYVLEIFGAGEELSLKGDLDITEDLTITVANGGTATIDHYAMSFQDSDRVFHVRSGSLSLTNITVTGLNLEIEDSELAGGVVMMEGDDLHIEGCSFTGNTIDITGTGSLLGGDGLRISAQFCDCLEFNFSKQHNQR